MTLEVKMTKEKGRGVFALVNFNEGDVVEVCPVIAIIRNDECPVQLEPFPYEWTKNKCAIVGGYASFYNHTNTDESVPNVDLDIDKKGKTVIFTCIAPIAKGDELTFIYRDDTNDFGFKVKS